MYKSSLNRLPAGCLWGKGQCQVSDKSPSALNPLQRERPAQLTHHRAPHMLLTAAGRGVPVALCAPSLASAPVEQIGVSLASSCPW